MALHTITPPTDILSPLTYANTVTGDMFGIFLWIFVMIITFIGLKAYGTEKALMVASVVALIVSVLLSPLSIMNPACVIGSVILLVVGMFLNV